MAVAIYTVNVCFAPVFKGFSGSSRGGWLVVQVMHKAMTRVPANSSVVSSRSLWIVEGTVLRIPNSEFRLPSAAQSGDGPACFMRPSGGEPDEINAAVKGIGRTGHGLDSQSDPGGSVRTVGRVHL